MIIMLEIRNTEVWGIVLFWCGGVVHGRHLDTVVEKTTAIIYLSVSKSRKSEPIAPGTRDYQKGAVGTSEQYCDLRKCSLDVIDPFMSSWLWLMFWEKSVHRFPTNIWGQSDLQGIQCCFTHMAHGEIIAFEIFSVEILAVPWNVANHTCNV